MAVAEHALADGAIVAGDGRAGVENGVQAFLTAWEGAPVPTCVLRGRRDVQSCIIAKRSDLDVERNSIAICFSPSL